MEVPKGLAPALRMRPQRDEERPPPVMSDPGRVRQLGYAERPAAAALRARLEAEQRRHHSHCIHFIAVRSADGTPVVGGSPHHHGATPDPFAPAAVDDFTLDEHGHAFDGPMAAVMERWTGTYASARDRLMLVGRPSDALLIVVVISGTGASGS